jgi:hypothetical protein
VKFTILLTLGIMGCFHQSAIIDVDLTGGYRLMAIDTPEQLEVSNSTSVIVGPPVFGYSITGDKIYVFKDGTVSVINNRTYARLTGI